MAVAPEIKEIGMLQLKAVWAVFEEPDEEAQKGISNKLLDDIKAKVPSIFKHYDTAPPHGFWGPEEAAIFCGHYAEHFPHIEVTLATNETAGETKLKKEIETKTKGLATIKWMGAGEEADAMFAKQVKELSDAWSTKKEEQKKTTKERMPKQLLSYQANKKERNDRAFQFLDLNRDQKIELSDLMSAMDPDNRNWIGGLGLIDGQRPIRPRNAVDDLCSCFGDICFDICK